ncbi:MAG: F0F1 ATP synthase subunit A [Candidatus Methylomirabilales bacterium]
MEAIETPPLIRIPNFIPWIPGPFIPDHVVMTWIVMAFLIVVSYLATRRLTEVPGPIQNVLEQVIEAFTGILDSIIGHEGRRYLALIGTAGLLIFFSNILILIPGLRSPTANLNTTASLAIAIFVSYHYFGVRKQGLLTYLKHFLGPVGEFPKFLLIAMGWILVPAFILVEVISHLARALSLSIRLFGNIFGEDTVFLFILFLTSIMWPIYALAPLISVLVIFTGLVQALIFVMLSTMYIAGAVETHHAEH